jgi:hypothetical protein
MDALNNPPDNPNQQQDDCENVNAPNNGSL